MCVSLISSFTRFEFAYKATIFLFFIWSAQLHVKDYHHTLGNCERKILLRQKSERNGKRKGRIQTVVQESKDPGISN